MCLFSIRGLIDITRTRSWHSCLSFSEIPAPILEFPREWPSLTLWCFGWRHSSGQLADCDGGSGKEQNKWQMKSKGWGWAGSSRAFSAAACVQNTAVPSRTQYDWNCFSHIWDQFARMEGASIFYGNNSNGIKKEGWVSPQPFYFFFFIFLTFNWSELMNLFFCRAEKKIDKFLPFRFFKLQRSVVQCRAC